MQPLPFGIPIRAWIWLPASIFLASLPLITGFRSAQTEFKTTLVTEGYRILEGTDANPVLGSQIDEPIAIFASETILKGRFEHPVVFVGRRLDLHESATLPQLRVRCAVVSGQSKDQIGGLEGSYQWHNF